MSRLCGPIYLLQFQANTLRPELKDLDLSFDLAALLAKGGKS